MQETGNFPWWSPFIRPSAEAFAEESTKSDYPRLLLVFVSLLFFGGIAPPHPAELWTLPWFSSLARSAGVSLIAFIFASIALFLVARLFKGSGTLLQHLYVIGLLAVPLAVILGLIGRIDVKQALLDLTSLQGLAIIILFLLILFEFLLLFLAIDGIHDLGGRKAVRVVGIVVLLSLLASFTYLLVAGVENTLVKYILYIWEKRIDLLDLSIAHAEIVLFSMAIAITLGIIIGIFITLPPHPALLWHALLLIPLAAFVLLWFGSLGTFGPEIQAWFAKGGPASAFLARPKAVGIIGLILLPILYALYILGEKASAAVLYTAGVLLTIPSIALFGIFIPIFGIGFFNAAVALILYAQLPILRNTYTGIKEVPSAVIESARGMGMTEWQILYKVKMPLAMPVIMAGVRVSMVMIVGIAAIATLIGVEVLGRYIFDGMQRISDRMVFAGAVAVSIFAILVDILLGWGEKFLTPRGLRIKSQRNEAA